jgi:hypothetical protein
MRLRLALLAAVLTAALSPPAPAAAQSYTYPPECSAYRLGLASTSDSTRVACGVARARVDRLNAAALVARYDSIAASYRARYATAARAETSAIATYNAWLAAHAPRPTPPPPTPSPSVAYISVQPERVTAVAGSAPVQLAPVVRSATGAALALPVVYAVAPAGIASVSSTGLVVPLAAGTATVTMTTPSAPTIARMLVVTVTAAQPPPPVVTTPPPTPGAPPGTIFSHPYPPPANGAAFAELPRDTVSLAVPAPTRRIVVASLQAALDTAQTGDLLIVPARSTTSCLLVKQTARAGWVTVQGTDSTSVITCGVGGATSSIGVNSRAHHVLFLGPLTITTSSTNTNAVVRSYNGETTVADVPHHIILDGVTIVVPRSLEARRCAWLDGAYMAIVNSTLVGCATKGGDAQAIFIANGPGPYRFEGNYLEGSHQCFMSGGGDPSIPQSIPSDVVFRRNTCAKPAYWHYSGTLGSQTYPGDARQVKTIIETKNIRRGLFEYNVLRVVYADAQAGFCGLFKSGNQDFTAPWSQSVDVTFRYNRCVSVAGGVNLAAQQQGATPMTRVTIYDNLFDSLSTVGGEGIPFQILDDVRDVVVMHNTVTNSTNNAFSFDGLAGVRTVVYANVVPHGDYGVKGSGSSDGNPTIARWMPGGIFQWNAIVGAPDCSLYPATNVCAKPSPLPVAPDGKPIGADLSKIP